MINTCCSFGERRTKKVSFPRFLGANARLDFWAMELVLAWLGDGVSRWYPPVAPEAVIEFGELEQRLVFASHLEQCLRESSEASGIRHVVQGVIRSLAALVSPWVAWVARWSSIIEQTSSSGISITRRG